MKRRSFAGAIVLLAVLITALVIVWPELRDLAGPTDEPVVQLDSGDASPEIERPLKALAPGPSIVDAGPLIRGRVIDPESGPLSEGRIDVYCPGAGFQSSARVGEDGEFELPACAMGPSCLRLLHPGVEQPHGWELESAAEVELEVEAAPSVSGTIFDHAGEVVAGAGLLVRRGNETFVGSSDTAGDYRVALPRLRPCDRCDSAYVDGDCRVEASDPPATATVLISATGFSPSEVEFRAEGPVLLDLELALPGPALSGRVLGVDGEPFDERTRVLATNRDRAHERHAALVDTQGRFSFDELAADAEYSLRAIRDEREIATLTLARPGEQVELRSALRAHGDRLTVEIVDPDGQAVADARVDGGPFWSAISDIDGRVAASEVLPGRYTLRVRTPDCPAIREAIELESGGAWVRRVHLPENC